MARDAALVQKRNEAIKKHFEELYNIQRMRHDDVIKSLSEQFYLSEKTIFSILYGKSKKP